MALDANHRECRSRLRVIAESAGREQLVVVADDFERLLEWPADEQREFASELARLAQTPDAGPVVVLIVRSDSMPHYEEFRKQNAFLDPGLVRVKPLDSQELREVIVKPATLIGLRFEEGLVEQLVDDVL
jgi:hypothetical protein